MLPGVLLSPNSSNQEEETTFLKLQCRDCEQTDCVFCPQGTYLFGLEGCTRKVTEETAARFNHYMEEVIPFWPQYPREKIKESYKEILDFLFEKVYSAPIGQKLDRRGKVKGSTL